MIIAIIVIIVLMVIYVLIIIHHLYKIKDDLKEQFKDLKFYQNHITQSIYRIEQSLYEIDAIVSDIEDEIKERK